MNPLRCILPFLMVVISSGISNAQILTGIATQWNDSFMEWTVYTPEEAPDGTLSLRWSGGKDWTEWQYSVGEHFGTIKQKWGDDPSQWELRSGNELITMRAIWKDDFRQWRVDGSGGQYDFICRYGNNWNKWQLKNGADFFMVYANWDGDPRDWIIQDELGDAYSFAEKMAMVFIAIFNSSPKQ